jgi:hypothetical protein
MELQIGLEYTYKPINQRVKIVWKNIDPGGVNLPSALVTVETVKGVPYTFPAARANNYLTTELPKRPAKYTSKS